MKHMIKCFLVLCLASVLILVGCTEEDTRESITGITFEDASFVYDGTPKSITISGVLPEGVTVTYDGNGKTDVGVYTVKASFNVGDKYLPLDAMEATLTITEDTTITISGVVDGETYYGHVSPTFNKGTATLAVNGSDPVPFTSGSELTELGTYVLTVSYKENVKVVQFVIAESYEVFENQITDLFENQMPHSSYIMDSGVDISIQNESLVMNNKVGGDPWGIVKREFNNVNATMYPYLEIDVEKVYDGVGVRLEVALVDEEWSTEPNMMTITYAGKYYINVLDYVTARGLSTTDATIFVKFAVVGASAGYAGVEINHYRSLQDLPEVLDAEQYVDNTIETLSLWRADTARLEIVDGEAVGYVTNTFEPYGRFIKRVELNTLDFQELIIDIKEVKGNASWSLKYGLLGSGNETTLLESSGSGKFSVDLSKVAGLKEQTSISVVFYFYVIGNGDNDYVVINGLNTQYLEPIHDPMIVENFKLDNWNVQLGSKAFEEGRFTLIKNENESMAKASKTLFLDTTEYHYIVFNFTTNFVLDDSFTILVINQGLDGWPMHAYKGASNVVTSVDNGDGTYTYEYALNLGLKEEFIDQENVGLFFEVVIEFGDPVKSVSMTSIEYFDPRLLPDPMVVENFMEDNWNVALGSKEFELGSFTLIKNENEGMAKASKTLNLNTVNYQALIFSLTTNFQIDAGFTIQVIHQGLPGWPMNAYKDSGNVLSRVDHEDGTYTYEYVLNLRAKEEFLNHDSVDLFFEIVIEFGDAVKSATFHSVRYYELPLVEDNEIVDDFSQDNWNVQLGSKLFEEGNFTLTKNENEGMAKASKTIELNTKDNQALVVSFTTNFQLDAGFAIQVIHQGLPGWPSYAYRGADYVEDMVDNGDGTYSYEFLIDLSLKEEFMNHLIVNLFFEIVIEYGDSVKSATFHSISYVTAE